MAASKEALFYHRVEGDRVECRLCPHLCKIPPKGRGRCRVRQNREGRLIATNYGQCTAVALDPMEKKPLYHFYPGSTILSVGTVGCNFHCQFCQNWPIAHGEPEQVFYSSRELVDTALAAADRDCVGIAYTYSEPMVWYEFVLDTSQAAKAAGLQNVLVTNGYLEQEPLHTLLPYVDAMNIDIKGFTQDFYRQTAGGSRDPVLRTAETAYRHGCHLEITTLLVTGRNDSQGEIAELVNWVVDVLGPEVPLHFSRYFPNYRMDLPPTPLDTLERAREIAQRRLSYVYLGNVPGEGRHTNCPHCQARLITREGYHTRITNLAGGRCRVCGQAVNIKYRENR